MKTQIEQERSNDAQDAVKMRQVHVQGGPKTAHFVRLIASSNF